MNKLKLGKKKLLGFMTAGAIVVTMAGSYAAWDQLDTSSSKTLTWSKPVITDLTMAEFQETKVWNDLPSYSSDITYNVSDLPEGTDLAAVQAQFTAVVKDGETALSTDDYSVTIKKGGSDLAANNIDENLSATNSYSVTVTPKDTEKARELATASKALTVTVEGKLSKK